MKKKFWLTRLLGRFIKSKETPTIESKEVQEPVVEVSEVATEDTTTAVETEEISAEPVEKATALTEEQKRRIRVLRYLGYQD